MAFGVESRVPFIDHCLVEWLADCRPRCGCRRMDQTNPSGRTLRGVLPERIRTRRSKMGFVTPASAWLAGPLAEWLHDTLSKPHYLADVVDIRGVKQLLARRTAGDRSLPLEDVLFYLAIYETWARQFLGPLTPRGNRSFDTTTSPPIGVRPHV